jgi:ribosome-binding ATPase YchF (GTP1/OBG family)
VIRAFADPNVAHVAGRPTLFAAGVDPALLRELHLLTVKPFLYVFNLDEDELANEAYLAAS